MKRTVTLRILLALMQFFVAVTAIPGGVALMINFNAPPVSLLHGSPFTSYFLPGLALAMGVGGSAAVATIVLLRKAPKALLYSIAAGLLLFAFEMIEIGIIGSPEGPGRVMQLLYICIAALVFVVSISLYRKNRLMEQG